jgi:hypothetical protein
LYNSYNEIIFRALIYEIVWQECERYTVVRFTVYVLFFFSFFF